MPKVTALGELLIDFVSTDIDNAGYPTLKANPGGAPSNYLAALSEYGVETALIGNVGNDAFGKLLKKTLDDKGIDTSCLSLDDDYFTTLAFVTLDENGNREFSFARKPGADTQIKLDEKSIEMIKSSDVFHFGTLSLTDEPSRSATMEAVRIAKDNGVIVSCDPNYRAPLWNSEDEARKWLNWAVSQADVVKISDEEGKFLWGLGEEKAAEKILSGNCSLCLITLGEKGCYYASENYSGYVSGIKVNPIDTTGAGDIFGGSLMSYILKNEMDIKALDETKLIEAVKFAVTAASLSTQKLGGLSSIVSEDEVRKAL